MAKKTATPKNKKAIPDFFVREWNGLNTFIKDQTELRDGESPDSLNWLTSKFKDHIELRRGYALLGLTRNGAGRVSGIGIGMMQNGNQIPFFSYAQKLKYYNVSTNDTVEIGSNQLPAPANGEDVAFMPYQNIAGSDMYVTSPSSSVYKIVTANPGDITDLKVKPTGYAKIDTNRMFMWNRRDVNGGKYQNDLLIGRVDQGTALNTNAPFAQTTKESAGSGDGSTKAFNHTLAFKSGNPLQTAFFTEVAAPIAAGVVITGITQATAAVITVGAHTLVAGNYVFIDSVVGMTQINDLFAVVLAVTATTITIAINSSSFTGYSSAGKIYLAEYFIDDVNGNMTSNLGGTGSINYTTGVMSVLFNTAPINAISVYTQYYTEDATNKGVADLTVTGTKGDGKIFSQFDGGGALMSVFPFDQVQYCFHAIKTWYLSLGSDDTAATNLPYRSTFGIPYWRSGFPTDDGILILNNALPSNPQVELLQIDASLSTAILTVVPFPISDNMDFSPYGFSKCVVRRWGDLDIMTCQNVINGVVDTNNTMMFVRSVYSQQWDRLDYPVSCLEEFNGMLLAGSSLQNNVFVLFSGNDDDSSLINNYWVGKQFDVNVEGVKRFHRFVIRGLIQQTQNLDISLSFDSGNFIKIFTVKGTGAYVNIGSPTIVGSNTVGSQVVGGGAGVGVPITAYPFEVEIQFASDLFEYVQPMFAANNFGFVQIDEFGFKDIRYKGKKLPSSRIVSSI